MSFAQGRPVIAIPGPSPVPDRVLNAMHRPSPDIYGPELAAENRAMIDRLKRLAGTAAHCAPYIGNGHAGWEAANVNLFNRGDRALVLTSGHFGRSWAATARAQGIAVEEMDFGMAPPDPQRLADRLAQDRAGSIKAVLVCQVDTASSARADIPALRAAMGDHPAFFAVDAIAALGCEPMQMDDWDVDLLVSASQKGLMVPPGLALIWFSDRLRAQGATDLVTPYWDWTPRIQAEALWQFWGGTPPVQHIFGMNEALAMLLDEETLPVAFARHEALARAREQLGALADDTARRLGEADSAIFLAQAELLNDPQLVTLASQKLVEGHGLAWSWHQAVQETAQALLKVGNPVLAGRAVDLRDVGSRVLALIDPSLAKPAPAEVPQDAILVADDLTPTDTATMDAERVAGLVTAQGGPTSHTAILARTLGLPAVVGAGAALSRLTSGAPAIIDGSGGRLYLNPSEADLASARAWIAEEEAKRARAAEARALPARTRDGHEVQIGANINLAEQAAFAIEQGAEGVGLMRTEFLFLERGDSPTEEDQYRAYSDMARAMGDRPLVIRALDIGGDKQVSYLDLPREENPFLGVRGARLLLRRPELLVPQVRALYRAARDGAQISVMFPMITSVAELLALRETCDRIRAELEAPAIPLGIMIEVPSAALLADQLAQHADFFSIGTNDLTQYALAIDRQNPVLAPEADSLHPAVLKLIDLTVRGAHAHGRWVGVCGGIAGDAFGAALLAGLGVDELSMTPRDIPAVKERIRQSDLSDLQGLAQQALATRDAVSVRALALPPVREEDAV